MGWFSNIGKITTTPAPPSVVDKIRDAFQQQRAANPPVPAIVSPPPPTIYDEAPQMPYAGGGVDQIPAVVNALPDADPRLSWDKGDKTLVFTAYGPVDAAAFKAKLQAQIGDYAPGAQVVDVKVNGRQVVVKVKV